MAALYDIRWLPDGPVEPLFGSGGDYYVLDENDHLALTAVPVWCHHCWAIALGEKIPALEEIDRDIRDMQVPGTDLYYLTHADMPEEFAAGCLAGFQRRRSWREARQSPAKCLGCGSSNIVDLPFDEPVRTPIGTLELRTVGFCRLSEEIKDRLFTPEGVRMRLAI
jgi:hypothetical protein